MERVLDEDKLYQDCSNVNLDDGSLLLENYKKKEVIYNKAFAEWNGNKSFLKLVEKYEDEEEQRLLEEKALETERILNSIDIDTLIANNSDTFTKSFINEIENHLLNEPLVIPSYRHNNYYYPRYDYTDVTIDNYEEFIESFEDFDEEIIIQMTNYDDTNFFYCVFAEEIFNSNLELLGECDYCDFFEKFDDELCDAGYGIWEFIMAYFSYDKLEELLHNNKYLKKDFNRLKEIESGVLKKIPERIPDLFPITRQKRRKFVLHLGPTNSGKTYSAVNVLKNANKGIYLGPLRLLAYEQYQKLNEEGYPCSLYTGEEHIIVENAKLQSSTVEIADPLESYDIAVIDEAQMVADRSRGWAWTKALLGLNANEIHVCAAPYAKDILINTIEECGDEYEIVEHKRQVPLLMDQEKFKFNTDHIQKGDALIVFSRRNVHAIARELQEMGKKCSVIYGNLPYDVRQEEARRFKDGETDVVVSTDAIGMGMNLPIKRVVFLEVKKFDGYNTRILTTEEFLQIAGRAGRYGMYEEGFWTVFGDKMMVKRIIDKSIPQIKNAHVGFPESLITIDANISDIIKKWNKIELPKGYVHSSLEHEMYLCSQLERKTDNKNLIYSFITIPFDEKNVNLMQIWNQCFHLVANKEKPTLQNMEVLDFSDSITLDYAEDLYKQYDLLYALFERFSKNEKEIDVILKQKHKLSQKIAEILKESKLPHRKCKYCGIKLAWNYPYGMCSRCHEERFPRRYNYNDWDDEEYYDEDWF